MRYLTTRNIVGFFRGMCIVVCGGLLLLQDSPAAQAQQRRTPPNPQSLQRQIDALHDQIQILNLQLEILCHQIESQRRALVFHGWTRTGVTADAGDFQTFDANRTVFDSATDMIEKQGDGNFS